MSTEPQTHFVYRIFAGFELLYVGCTSQPEARLLAHARTKPWWPEVTDTLFVGPLPKYDALTLETAITAAEDPRYSLSGREVGLLAATATHGNDYIVPRSNKATA